jgi:hypothetical protein
LSFPVLAGHTLGDNRFCPCDNPESCSGQNVRLNDSTPQEDGTTQDTTEIAVLLMLALWLKLRA